MYVVRISFVYLCVSLVCAYIFSVCVTTLLCMSSSFLCIYESLFLYLCISFVYAYVSSLCVTTLLCASSSFVCVSSSCLCACMTARYVVIQIGLFLFVNLRLFCVSLRLFCVYIRLFCAYV